MDLELEMTVIEATGQYTGTPCELLPPHDGLMLIDREFCHVVGL